MRRFEYKFVRSEHACTECGGAVARSHMTPIVVKILNEFGEQGWEVVTLELSERVVGIWLKREKP